MHLTRVRALLSPDVPDLDLCTRTREDPIRGRVPLDVSRLPPVARKLVHGLEVPHLPPVVACPSLCQDRVVDPSNGYAPVLSSGRDKGVVEGRPGRVEDGSGVRAAEGELVWELGRERSAGSRWMGVGSSAHLARLVQRCHKEGSSSRALVCGRRGASAECALPDDQLLDVQFTAT